MKVLLLDVMSTLVYDPFFREMPAFFGLSIGNGGKTRLFFTFGTLFL